MRFHDDFFHWLLMRFCSFRERTWSLSLMHFHIGRKRKLVLILLVALPLTYVLHFFHILYIDRWMDRWIDQLNRIPAWHVFMLCKHHPSHLSYLFTILLYLFLLPLQHLRNVSTLKEKFIVYIPLEVIRKFWLSFHFILKTKLNHFFNTRPCFIEENVEDIFF